MIRPHHIGSMISVVALSAAIAGCADEPSAPQPSEPRFSAEALRAAYEASARAELAAASHGRKLRGFEEEILRAEDLVPGLGGVYFDAGGNVVVYLQDVANAGRAVAALATIAADAPVHPETRAMLVAPGRIMVVPGKFAFSSLVAWQAAFTRRHSEIRGLNSIDADESLNRVRISVSSESYGADAERVAAQAGVPPDAVVIEVGPANQLTADNLRRSYLPTGGGLQIQNANEALCSLGFNVTKADGTTGFLTASHCTNGPIGDGWILDPIHQSLNSGGNFLGDVQTNPPWNSTLPGCEGMYRCTGADAEFVAYTTSSSSAKRVAYTAYRGENSNGGSISITGWWNNVAPPIVRGVGESVDKMGRTTGWTRGNVASTCDHFQTVINGQTYMVQCAIKVTNARGGKGDSGSPIFVPPADGQMGQSLYPIGIMFGGTNDYTDPYGDTYCTGALGPCIIWYSTWQRIEEHFGFTVNPSL